MLCAVETSTVSSVLPSLRMPVAVERPTVSTRSRVRRRASHVGSVDGDKGRLVEPWNTRDESADVGTGHGRGPSSLWRAASEGKRPEAGGGKKRSTSSDQPSHTRLSRVATSVKTARVKRVSLVETPLCDGGTRSRRAGNPRRRCAKRRWRDTSRLHGRLKGVVGPAPGGVGRSGGASSASPRRS